MAKEKKVGIYKITSPTGRVYIGRSVDIDDRIRVYKRGCTKAQPKIHRSIKKYGFENHVVEIVELCQREELDEREIFYINYFNSTHPKCGLNCKGGGSSGIPTEETRRKMSKSQMGMTKTPETVAKWKKTMATNGYKVSDETRAKIGIKHKGKEIPLEMRERIRKTLTGYKHTEEAKRNMAANKPDANKRVLDTDRGVIYNSVHEAAEAYGIQYKTMSKRLTSNSPLSANLVVSPRINKLWKYVKRHDEL